ncbi:hypothetical protein [Streptomyces sp. YIM B13518]|uniref:hypothetical protein n=1 Tax=Streptomyces sp. YIM B13518 TaxID=3366316 RepID=UPI0036C31F1C
MPCFASAASAGLPTALEPGGWLVCAALAPYLNGASALPDVVAADVLVKTPDGAIATMRRRILQEHVWTKLFDEAGFIHITIGVRPDTPTGCAAPTRCR